MPDRSYAFSRFGWRASILVVLLSQCIAMLACTRRERLRNNFPHKLPVRVGLPPSADSVAARTDRYQSTADTVSNSFSKFFPDSGVLVERVEILTNEHLRITQYRRDRTVRELTEWYKSESAGAPGTIRHRATFANDGRTFLTDTLFRQDSTLELAGTRLPDATFELKRFGNDGSSVSEHLVFSREGLLMRKRLYYADGSLAVEAQRQADNSIVTTEFARRGRRISESIEDSLGWKLTTRYFRADGQSVKITTVQDSYGTAVEYFRSDGTLQEKRFYRFYGWMIAVIYDHGRISYRQEWRIENPADSSTRRLYRLEKLTEVGFANQALRTIEFHSDGVTPSVVTIAAPESSTNLARTDKTYRSDGTLQSTSLYGEDGNLYKTVDYQRSQRIYERFDRRRTALSPLEEPRLKPLQSRAKPMYPVGG